MPFYPGQEKFLLFMPSTVAVKESSTGV